MNFMVEIIFSDLYRTILLCVLYVCIAFGVRNSAKRKKALAFLGYETVMLMPFLYIYVLGMVISDFNVETQRSLVIWESRWILYFTVITISQLLVYQLLWKNSKALKMLAVFISAIIVAGPLCIIDFQKLSW